MCLSGVLVVVSVLVCELCCESYMAPLYVLLRLRRLLRCVAAGHRVAANCNLAQLSAVGWVSLTVTVLGRCQAARLAQMGHRRWRHRWPC